MNVFKNLLTVLSVLALLISTKWFFFKSKVSLLAKDTLVTHVDTTITNLRVQQFNSEGVLVNLMTTPWVEHIPKEEVHHLKTPHIVIKEADKDSHSTWEINALSAKSYRGGRQIDFINDVRIHEYSSDSTLLRVIKTQELSYFPKEKKATTSCLVTFEELGNIVQSTGMNAYLKEKRIELLHRAEAHYAPANG